MIVTPTAEHGPIAGKKIGPGEWEVFNPGDPMEVSDYKGQGLISRGKAVLYVAPASADKGVVDYDPAPVPKKKTKKRGGKKDAGSSNT
jgi:hypothetical protein